MRKFQLLLCSSCIFLSLLLISCGGKSDGGSDSKVSAEMKEFMGMLQGKSDATDAALNKYATEGLDKKDMNMYDLKNPKVIATDKDCYTLEAASGMTTRTYVICWEGGKIKTVEDKGMK
ncbi:MAG: hypothetical protein H7Y01_06715 [Ferruginibacter sp.]|nr:hypothetical protein [Chitinophagaceae bacterium]